ncbi:MAG: hypothetical protein HY747_06405 [Elusimicrobia bacterium]|nr:hypothetical protein [Elusimicrobiota bacterium]
MIFFAKQVSHPDPQGAGKLMKRGQAELMKRGQADFLFPALDFCRCRESRGILGKEGDPG